MYEQQRKLVENVVTQMQVCADMLGARDEGKKSRYGFVPGLDELETAKSLQTRIDTIRKGIFQVMFTGCFNAGKSTLINALICRDVLQTGPNPETAVITKIFFSTEREQVVIYKRDQFDEKGQSTTETMYDLKAFFKEYRVDQQDLYKFLRNIDHVEMFLQTRGIAGSTVQLVDSPGTQASTADDEISKKFVEHADAIVFLISALEAMGKHDKDYINERFANRQVQNVFFVVNRINQLNTPKDVAEVKSRVREELKDVFKDARGNFNQALYDKRVFYIDAFASLNTRLGKETPITPKFSRMVPDDETGVPQFEAVLGEFLTSGDKDKVALSAYRPQLASIYITAEKAVANRQNFLSRSVKENRRILTDYENAKDEIENELNAIEKAIQDTERNILHDARNAYDNFLDEINNGWDAYFADKTDSMQISYFKLILAQVQLKLAFWQNNDQRQIEADIKTDEATQAFADGIKTYLKERGNDLSREFEFKLRNNIAQLMTELNNRQKRLEELSMPINIEEIIQKIALDKNIPIKGVGENNASLGQAFVAIFFADPELVITAGGGDRGTTDFIIDIIKTNVVDLVIASVLFSIIGNIFAIIAFVIYKIVRSYNRNQNMTQRLIKETKVSVLDGYDDNAGNHVSTGLRGEYKKKYLNKASSIINGVMSRASTDLIYGIQDNLIEVEDNLMKTNELIQGGECALQNERDRMEKILDTIARSISKISELTDSMALTVPEIRKLAVTA